MEEQFKKNDVMDNQYKFYHRVVDDLMKSVKIRYFNGQPSKVDIITEHLYSTMKYGHISSLLKQNYQFYDDLRALYGCNGDEVHRVIDVLVDRIYGR